MLGSGFKKLAKEKGMAVKNGVAYGVYGGYTVTFNEGSGWKAATFAAQFDTQEKIDAVSAILGDKAFKKNYRITGFAFATYCVTVNFTDTAGTIKRISEFLDVFTRQLASLGIQGATVCSHCGQPLDKVVHVLKDGVVLNMHESCIAHLNEEAGIKHEEAKSNGSVLAGTVGALLGGIIGSVPWAVAYYFGWFVGWLGFLIGIAAKKGYELLKGKETRVKSAIIIAVTIICVILVEFVTGIIGWNIEFANDPELASYGLSFSQIASLFIEASIYDAEMRGAIIGDLVLGLIFAGLGIYSTVFEVFRKTGKNSGVAIRLD